MKKLLCCCSGCKDNGAMYQVAKLAMRPELDLRNVTNISSVSFDYFHICDMLAFCVFSETACWY